MKMTQLLKVVMLLVAGAVSQSVQAQIVPFRSVGSNATYFPGTPGYYNGTGNTTHMGRTTVAGDAITYFLEAPSPTQLVFVWETSGEFVAKNGDKLFYETVPADFPQGSGTPDPNTPNKVFVDTSLGNIWTATWVGEAHVTGGTGRLANVGPASEPLDIFAVNPPFNPAVTPWLFDYAIRGEIDLGRK